MIGSGVKRGAGQSRTREVLAKAPSQGYAGCTRGPAGGTADHSVREKDGSLWVGAGAGGSEKGCEGVGGREREPQRGHVMEEVGGKGDCPSSAGARVHGGTHRHTSAFALCV